MGLFTRPPSTTEAVSEDETAQAREMQRILQVKWWRYRHLFFAIKRHELVQRR